MAQAISDLYEYVVEKKKEGKYLAKRILMIFLYIFTVVAGLLLCMASPIPQLFALAPVSVWIFVYFTWPYFSVDYEYVLADGNIIFSTVYGGRKRKENFSVRISSFEKVAPFRSPEDTAISSFKPTKEFVAFASEKNPSDPYYALFKDEKGTKCIFFFEATNRTLRILKYYNPSVEMTTVSK